MSNYPKEKGLDLFVERIPFKEAREYVGSSFLFIVLTSSSMDSNQLTPARADSRSL